MHSKFSRLHNLISKNYPNLTRMIGSYYLKNISEMRLHACRTWCSPSPWATILLGSFTIVFIGLPGISSPLNTKWMLYSPGLFGINDTLYRPGAVGRTSTGTFPAGPRHWMASSPSPAPEVSTSKEEGRPNNGLRTVSEKNTSYLINK